ncbi:hypothetical protein F5Y19DRAFT_325117 [Xylariaceae sp. FL1651]|nr:hypothetical protein F5Y19DRAFT_325117 [Xylariaceae sp. FL1651]
MPRPVGIGDGVSSLVSPCACIYTRTSATTLLHPISPRVDLYCKRHGRSMGDPPADSRLARAPIAMLVSGAWCLLLLSCRLNKGSSLVLCFHRRTGFLGFSDGSNSLLLHLYAWLLTFPSYRHPYRTFLQRGLPVQSLRRPSTRSPGSPGLHESLNVDHVLTLLPCPEFSTLFSWNFFLISTPSSYIAAVITRALRSEANVNADSPLPAFATAA